MIYIKYKPLHIKIVQWFVKQKCCTGFNKANRFLKSNLEISKALLFHEHCFVSEELYRGPSRGPSPVSRILGWNRRDAKANSVWNELDWNAEDTVNLDRNSWRDENLILSEKSQEETGNLRNSGGRLFHSWGAVWCHLRLEVSGER